MNAIYKTLGIFLVLAGMNLIFIATILGDGALGQKSEVTFAELRTRMAKNIAATAGSATNEAALVKAEKTLALASEYSGKTTAAMRAIEKSGNATICAILGFFLAVAGGGCFMKAAWSAKLGLAAATGTAIFAIYMLNLALAAMRLMSEFAARYAEIWSVQLPLVAHLNIGAAFTVAMFVVGAVYFPIAYLLAGKPAGRYFGGE